MAAEVILGVVFVLILIVFVAGLFLFPHVFGISKELNNDDDGKSKK